MATPVICSIPECCNRVVARGWCRKHYTRWHVHGSVDVVKSPYGEVLPFFENVVLPYQSDECLLWPFSKAGYGYGKLLYNGRWRNAHRLICEMTHGEPPTELHEAAHSCGVAACVNKRHISWKTTTENHADKLLHGTDNRGERHNMARLKSEDIFAIRRLGKTMPRREIARIFGISYGYVGDILRRARWGWLNPSDPT